GHPEWEGLFRAFGIPVLSIGEDWQESAEFVELWNSPGPAAFIVPIDPEQTYFPKISSRVRADGGMESNPLHLMSPDLPDDVAAKVFTYLREADASGGDQA
ncbi:MAG: thiamine pyrophosphate-binding protein, partial [Miltoncostaeaceae bacterium]